MAEDWYKGIFLLALSVLTPEYVSIALVFVSAVFLIKCIKKESLKINTGVLGMLTVLYVITAFFSIIFAIDKMHSLLMALLWATMMLAYIYVTTVVTTRARFRITLQTLAVTAAFCGVISILQYVINLFGNHTEILNLWYPLDKLVYDTFLPVKLFLQWEDVRTASVFSNPNLYAMEMIILLPLSLYCFMTAEKKHSRIMQFMLFIIGFIGVLFTYSRGGYLSFIIIFAVLWILYFSHSKISRWILISTIVATVLFIVIPNPFTQRLSTISMEDISISQRIDSWYVAYDAFKESPVFGYGIGSLNVLELLKSAGITNIPHVHNVVLEILLEGGLIAVAIFAAMLFHVYAANLKLHRGKSFNDNLLGVTFLAIACGFMLFSMADFPMSTPKGIILFLTLYALSDTASALSGVCPFLKKRTK